ncbi:hypothetical protein ScPMuIL_018167 [Solemya velum]
MWILSLDQHKELAKKYGIERQTVADILKRKTTLLEKFEGNANGTKRRFSNKCKFDSINDLICWFCQPYSNTYMRMQYDRFERSSFLSRKTYEIAHFEEGLRTESLDTLEILPKFDMVLETMVPLYLQVDFRCGLSKEPT